MPPCPPPHRDPRRRCGGDEEGTHERLKAHRRELADPKVAEHRGRIVKNTATASWRNLQVLWMPSAAVSKCNEGWLIATRRRPRTSASHSGSRSTSAMYRRRARYLPASHPIASLRRRSGAIAVVAGVASVELVITIGAWWAWPAVRTASTPSATAVAAATPRPRPLVAPRQSIVVLPFANRSDDPMGAVRSRPLQAQHRGYRASNRAR